ncbi:MAG TPA: cystathionine gamma-synthase [Sphingomicrobium sp.]|nr:cystathionine gamma-synthase [Sphingomicrobium sp.]
MTKLATRAVRAGIDCDPAYGAVTPPIVLSANFTFDELGKKRAYDYGRSGNPTRDQLADALASLEGGVGGIITSTGMSAIALVVQALVTPGDRVLIPHDCYGGTWRLFKALAERGAFELEVVDFTRAESAEKALARKARLVWIETPSNPLLRITNITEVASAAKVAGALVVADNTFLSPALQRPIEHGADVVVHSTTKFINGHSDVVGGAVIAADAAVLEEIGWWANALGLVGSPFDSFLTLRGLRTLNARQRVHEENTKAVAEILGQHRAVSRLYYPGCVGHPGHAIARKQQDGFGSLISFELAGAEDAVRRFVSGLQCISLAESLGGVESLISHPTTMSHASMDECARQTAGILPGLLRFSVGIEDPDDLVADLISALDRAAQPALKEAC